MREQLLSAVIVFSLGLYAHSALAVKLETTPDLDGTSASGLRFKVLANRNFEKLINKGSVSAATQKQNQTCRHRLLARMPNLDNAKKYIPIHESIYVARLVFFSEPKHMFHKGRSVTVGAHEFVSPVSGPSPTPYLESIGRFLDLLEYGFELTPLSTNSAC